MLVRQPNIDYVNVRPHWAPNPEFAQHHNASSTIPVHVEPYLIKVLGKAKPLLDPANTEMLAAMDIFAKQEGQHFRQHAAFNQALVRAGYIKIPEFEQKLRKQLLEWLNNRPLKFNLAYAEGFEAMGPPSAAVWFEESDPFLAGADAEAVDLWKWHMAEEFEHREVCFDLYHKIYSRGPVSAFFNGWLYRVYGFLFAVFHLGAYIETVSSYLIEQDRQNMTPGELAASKARLKQVKAAFRRNMLPRLLLVLSPFYTPRRKRIPNGLLDFLKRFEPGGDRAHV
jgi:predicted metal-dependent hydrolase